MITLINLKKTPNTPYNLYIGRENTWLNLAKSKWCNPFRLLRESERLVCVEKFYNYVVQKSDLIESLSELDDLILACYCFPKFCHGNILIYLREKQKLNISWEKTFSKEVQNLLLFYRKIGV